MFDFAWIYILYATAAMSLVMILLWLVQRRTSNAGWVDVGWTFGVGGVVCAGALFSTGDPLRRIMIAIMIAVWSVRLGIHILGRVRRESEDGRYSDMRESYSEPRAFQRFLFWFYQFQALWVALFAIAPLSAMTVSFPFGNVRDVTGFTVWLTAWIGESLADRQLAAFKKNPKNHGRVCQVGLWRYSRHPNYFFEWVHWWAYVAISVGAMNVWPALIFGPGLMLLFLLKVTGVPPTERQALKSRGDAYRDYQETTSVLIPWFRQRSRSADNERL